MLFFVTTRIAKTNMRMKTKIERLNFTNFHEDSMVLAWQTFRPMKVQKKTVCVQPVGRQGCQDMPSRKQQSLTVVLENNGAGDLGLIYHMWKLQYKPKT